MNVKSTKVGTVILGVVAIGFVVDRLLQPRNKVIRRTSELVQCSSIHVKDGVPSQELTMLEHEITNVWIQVAYRYEKVLDEVKLKHGLMGAIMAVPAISGRVADRGDGFGHIVIEEGNNGVLFEVVEYEESIEFDLPDAKSTNAEWISKGIVPAPRPPVGKVSNKMPLLQCRLIIFKKEQVSFISVEINHALADVHSLIDFMNLWSDACAGKANASLENARMIDHPAYPVFSDVESKHELIAKFNARYSRFLELWWAADEAWRWFKAFPTIFYHTFIGNSHVEYEVSRSKLKQEKEHIMGILGHNEWVSTFEVFTGHILHNWMVYSKQSALTVAVIVDLRGRIPEFPKEYFGNLSVPAYLTISADEAKSSVGTIVALHEKLRNLLDNPKESIYSMMDLAESSRQLGCPITTFQLLNFVQGKHAMLNEWISHDWFSCARFDNEAPSAWGSFIDRVGQLMITITPKSSHDGDYRIVLATPSKKPDLYDTIPFLTRTSV